MDGFDWKSLWEKGKAPLVFGLVGLVLVSGAVFTSLFFYGQGEPEIEIISEEEETGTIWVDLAGAVEKPGVYELPIDSRIKDVLTLAGGLSALADREWVEKNLNLAQKVLDGAKLYIPGKGELAEEGSVAGESASLVGKININTASVDLLDTLWGIGPVRAQDIADGRPYQSVEELKVRKIVPDNVFEKIKEKISVY